MTPERLAEIKSRAEAATPGPWEAELQEVEVDHDGTEYPYTGAWVPRACPWEDGDGYVHMDDANAEFIANARQDIPDLLAEVERLREHVATLEHGNKDSRDRIRELESGVMF